MTGFWLKYLDPFIADRPGAVDAASAFYFMGRRSDGPIDDRELIAGYRGSLNNSGFVTFDHPALYHAPPPTQKRSGHH